MEKSVKLALLASAIHLVGYAIYNSAALVGVSQPNVVPWAIWGLMAVLNNETYRIQTGDRIKAMLTTSGAFASVATFIIAVLMGGTFRTINTVNAIALVIGIVAIVVWKMGSAKYANWCVLVAAVAGFIPFFKVLWVNPHAENPLAWGIWTVSTFLSIVVVAMRKGKREDFLMPVVIWAFHGATFALITLR